MDQSAVMPKPVAIGTAASVPEPAVSASKKRSASRLARWFARFGVVGFLFFLIKGLLWLAVPAIVIAWRGS